MTSCRVIYLILSRLYCIILIYTFCFAIYRFRFVSSSTESLTCTVTTCVRLEHNFYWILEEQRACSSLHMSACLSVCLSVCLPVCLSVRLHNTKMYTILLRAVPEIILGGPHFFQTPPTPGRTWSQSPPTLTTVL